MSTREAASGPAVPIELLSDSQAALRRAEALLAELRRGAAPDAGLVAPRESAPRSGEPAAEAAIAVRGLRDLGEDLRRVRVEIDRATGDIAGCLSDARALLAELQRRVERVARVAEEATIPAGDLARAPGAPAPPAMRAEPSPPPVRRA